MTTSSENDNQSFSTYSVADKKPPIARKQTAKRHPGCENLKEAMKKCQTENGFISNMLGSCSSVVVELTKCVEEQVSTIIDFFCMTESAIIHAFYMQYHFNSEASRKEGADFERKLSIVIQKDKKVWEEIAKQNKK